MVTLWDESVAVVAQMGVIFPAISPYSLGYLLGRLAFRCLWTLKVVSIAVFFSSSYFEGVGFLLMTGLWFWPLLLEFVSFLVILFFVAFRDILGSYGRHRSVLCRMFWTDCLCFGCGALRPFRDFMLPQFVLVLVALWQVP